MTIRKPLVLVSITAAVAALSACSPLPDSNYHGTVSSTAGQWPATAAPPPISTVSTPSVPAVPVTLTGSGEQVETVDLIAAGYTITYRASSFTLVVQPVQADGSDGSAVINAIGQDSSSGVTGTTTYHATGRTTFHVSNTEGSWSLTFNPLT